MVMTEEERRSSRWSAMLVAGGILLSRVAGLVRERVLAHYFGTSLYADVFRAALRMPNVLQNLLGEGTLSASFIPVYSELLEQKRYREAGRVAGAVFALLLVVVAALVLLGITLAPLVVAVFAPGFVNDERWQLAITCTRIIFPMTGTLVLAAWALGILNSHRKFFVPYVAPVLWNTAMIATLVYFGGRLDSSRLLEALCWGALVGGGLQLAVQLPWVLRLERRLKVCWDLRLKGVREAVRNAGPAVLGRGVVQLGGWLDLLMASLLTAGAVAAVGYAQTLYMLPVSLFGMSVAAAELPELSRRRNQAETVLCERISNGLRRVAFLVVPSAVGYLVIGDLLVAALYQTGDFDAADTRLVYLVLAGYSIGLIASTGTRLLSSAFFALHDTGTPARVALVRVATGAAIALHLMFRLDQTEIGGKPLGALGLSIAAGVAAWLEWLLLRRALRRRIGPAGVGAGVLARMLAAALLGAAAARGLALLVSGWHPIPVAAVALAGYGTVYFSAGHLLGLREVSTMAGQVLSKLGLQRKG
jgi:putative peptidoglycan lipid II flippase